VSVVDFNLSVSDLDLPAFAERYQAAESLAKATVTYQLWLICQALTRLSQEDIMAVLVDQVGYSPQRAMLYITTAKSVGVERLGKALNEGAYLTMDHWLIVAARAVIDRHEGGNSAERAYALAAEAVPALEVRAAMEGKDLHQVHVERAIARLDKALMYCRELGVDQSIVDDLLARYGYAVRVVRQVKDR
jgi:hypothetical protein